jgi:hypothetical protein
MSKPNYTAEVRRHLAANASDLAEHYTERGERAFAAAFAREALRLEASADRFEALSEQRRKRAAKLRRIKAAWANACGECKIQNHSACLARDFPELDKCTCPLCHPTT